VRQECHDAERENARDEELQQERRRKHAVTDCRLGRHPGE